MALQQRAQASPTVAADLISILMSLLKEWPFSAVPMPQQSYDWSRVSLPCRLWTVWCPVCSMHLAASHPDSAAFPSLSLQEWAANNAVSMPQREAAKPPAPLLYKWEEEAAVAAGPTNILVVSACPLWRW